MTTTYKVQGPDGSVHLIQGPDNASPADVEAFAAQSIPTNSPANPMANPTPQPQPSLWDSIKTGAGNLAYGLAKGVADPIYGVTQLGMHGLNALSGGAMQGATDQYDNVIKGIEDQYQADTPGSVVAGVGRLAGNLASPMKPVQAMAGATILPRIVNAGVTGGVIGALQPVTAGSDAPYLAQKGTQIGLGAVGGAGLSAAGAVAGGGLNALRPLLAPKSATGNLLLGGALTDGSSDVNALIDKLENAPTLVDGSQPTTAQVAGIPSLVMAEKTMKNNPAYTPAFIQRSNDNNAARLAALRDVAKTPDDLQAAIQARTDAASPLYDQAAAEVHTVDPALQAILDRPSAKAAIARGQNLAKETGQTVGVQGGAPPSPILDASGQPMAAATAPTVDGKTLQYLKMGVDDLQKEGNVAGMGAHESAALNATRSDLDNWLTQNSPTFKKANSTFAAASVPINTMQAGQSVLSALEGGTLNSVGDINPALSQFRAKYAAALKASPYGIDPQAKATLDAIQNDLQRETVSNSVRAGSGSDTAFNLQAPNWLAGKLFGNSLDGQSTLGKVAGGVGGFLTGGPVGAYGGVKGAQAIGNLAGSRVNNQLSQALLDPAYFAQLLKEAQARAAPSTNLLAGTTGGALLSRP